MFFGNKSKFGIEFELLDSYEGVWLYGKFCYWLNSCRLGNFNLVTSLRDVLFQLFSVLKDNGNRNHNELFPLEINELYQRLDSALFGYLPSNYDQVAIEETWARFNICLPVDIFDEWKIYLVENGVKSRFIIKHKENIYEVLLDSGEFDEVIKEAYEKLDELYDNEVSKLN